LENAARFPLFHRSGDDGVSILNVESGHFTCYKNRTSSRANNMRLENFCQQNRLRFAVHGQIAEGVQNRRLR
jgi:hypothetical protein